LPEEQRQQPVGLAGLEEEQDHALLREVRQDRRPPVPPEPEPVGPEPQVSPHEELPQPGRLGELPKQPQEG
jgi:hypothetical protein